MTLSGAPATLHQSNLQAQTLTQASTTTAGVTTTTVTTSNTAVTWATCSGTCTGSFGWYANLPGSLGATNSAGAALTEQIASAPGLYQSALVVNSAIPANNQILSCSSSTTDGGVTYAISMATGGIFNSTGGGTQSAFTAFKNTTTVGVLSNETGALAVVNTTEGTTYLLGQLIQVKAPTGSTAGQVAGLQQVSLPSNVKYTRLTWVELR
jgi:type IV pilus assembly protein PilY1